MKSCCVPLCANDSNKRPDLKYFTFPRNINLREEWLEVIGFKANYRGPTLYVCENHFSHLDFKADKKELKAHAVPTINFGVGDADFTGSNYRPELEIVVVKDEEAQEKKPWKEEPLSMEEPMECEPGRRPSRRAAVAAAKKIFNTAHHLNGKDGLPIEESSSEPSPSQTPSKPKQVRRKRRNFDLEMFCVDEGLSDIQTTCQLNAQNDFNLAMKNMRELTACPVTVLQTGPNPVNFNVSVNVFADDENYKAKLKKKLSKSHDPNVFPVFLTKLSNMEKTPVIYV